MELITIPKSWVEDKINEFKNNLHCNPTSVMVISYNAKIYILNELLENSKSAESAESKYVEKQKIEFCLNILKDLLKGTSTINPYPTDYYIRKGDIAFDDLNKLARIRGEFIYSPHLIDEQIKFLSPAGA